MCIRYTFEVTNNDIYNLLAANDADAYMQIRKSAEIGSGPCIYQHGLFEWLELLCPDDVSMPNNLVIEYPSFASRCKE